MKNVLKYALTLIIFIFIIGIIFGNSPEKQTIQPSISSTPAKILSGIKAQSIDRITDLKYKPEIPSDFPEPPKDAKYYLETFKADGENSAFLLSNSYEDIIITLNEESLLIGTDKENQKCGTGNSKGADVCYNFEGKKFIFPTIPKKDSIVILQGYIK